MTDSQLYFSIGVPTIAVLASLVVSLVQISGLRDSLKDIREDIREVHGDMREIRQDIKILTGKVADIDTRLALLEHR